MKRTALKLAAACAAGPLLALGVADTASAEADFSNVWGCVSANEYGPGVYRCSDHYGNQWYTDRPDINPFFYYNIT